MVRAKRKLNFSGRPSSAKRSRSYATGKLTRTQATRVRSLLNSVETKEFGGAATLTVTTNPLLTPSGADLYNIVQGQTDLTRVGDKITVTRWRIHGHLVASTPQEVALVLVRDKQCNGAVPSINSLYNVNGGDVANAFMSNIRAPDNRKRYEILGRKQLVFSTGAGLNKAFSFDIKKRMTVSYDASGGIITDLTEDNVFLVACQLGGTTSTCTGPVYTTISYEDL